MSAESTPAALAQRAAAELAQGGYETAKVTALVAIAGALVARMPEPITVSAEPRIVLDDDGTLDDFMAKDVRMVHFEAIDNAAWYATIALTDGTHWQLNFGAQDTEAPGFARAERVE